MVVPTPDTASGPPTRLVVVQHGDKVRDPGDPGLSPLGHEQAAAVAAWLARHQTEVVAIRASPLRRAQETARPIAEVFGLVPTLDEGLRERMNWDGSMGFDDFLADWARTTADRSFQPRVGDSSRAAATRFFAALDDLAASIPHGSTAIVVTHGGVTVDVLRTILGDEPLAELAPALLREGVPSCAVTRLARTAVGWTVTAPPSTRHLA